MACQSNSSVCNVNTVQSEENGRYFAKEIFECILVWVLVYPPKCMIAFIPNNSTLVHVICNRLRFSNCCFVIPRNYFNAIIVVFPQTANILFHRRPEETCNFA